MFSFQEFVRMWSEDRNYKKEYKNYHSRPEQIVRRSKRNEARRKLKNRKNLKGMDVHHKDNDPLNNDRSNLSIVTQKYNRTEPRLRETRSFKEFIGEAMRQELIVYIHTPEGKETKKIILKRGLLPGLWKVHIYKRSMYSSSAVDYGLNQYKKRYLDSKVVMRDIKSGKLPPKDYHVFALMTKKEDEKMIRQLVTPISGKDIEKMQKRILRK